MKKLSIFLNVSGSVQQWPLPSSEFTWMEEKSLENVTKITQMIKSYSLSGSVGAILEVDIEYPAELHTRDRSFPLLCRNKKIQFKNLTRKQKKILRKNHPTEWNNKSFKASRLISSLKSERKYVGHIAFLQFLLEKGLKITKVKKDFNFFLK